MRLRFWFLTGLSALMMAAVIFPVTAQDRGTYTFPSGAFATYPAGWEVQTLSDGRDIIVSEDSIVALFDPDLAASFRPGSQSGDLVDGLGVFFPGWDYTEGQPFDAALVQVTTLGGRDAAIFDFTDSFGDEAVLIALRFFDGRTGYVSGTTFGGDLTERGEIIQVAATFDFPGGASANNTIKGASVTSDDNQPKGEDSVVGDPVGAITYTFLDGTSLLYDPSVWFPNGSEDDDFLFLEGEGISASFELYTAETMTRENLPTPADVIAYDFELLELTQYFDPSGLEEVRIAETAATQFAYIAETDSGPLQIYVIGIPLESGGVMRVRIGGDFVDGGLPGLSNALLLTRTVAPTAEIETSAASSTTPLPRAYTFDGTSLDITVNYPNSWEVTQEDDGFIYFVSDYTTYVPGWYGFSRLEEEGLTSDDLAGAIGVYFSPADEALAFNPANVKIQEIDGQRVASYAYVDTDDIGSYTVTILATEMTDGFVFFSRYYPRFGEQTIEGEAALSIFLNTILTEE